MVRSKVTLSERAVTKIVAAAAESVPGTVQHSAGIDRLAGRALPRFDVLVDDARRTASVEAFIAVSWPSPVVEIAKLVRQTIHDHVQKFCGIKVEQANVVVGAVIPSPTRLTSESLAVPDVSPSAVTVRSNPIRHPQAPLPQLLRPIQVRTWQP